MKLHLFINDQQAGPYDLDEIASMLQQGDIGTDTLAWQESQNEWVPLGQVVDVGVKDQSADQVLQADNTPSQSPVHKAPTKANIFLNKKFHYAAVGLVILIGGVFFFLRGNDSTDPSGATSGVSDGVGLQGLFEKYLEATSVEERAKLVKDGDIIISEMKEHYKGSIGTSKLLSLSNEKKIYDKAGIAMYSVVVEREGKNALGGTVVNKKTYYYCKEGGKLYIDWHASLGINEYSLKEMKAMSLTDPIPVRLRLNAKLDDYYNYEYRGLEQKVLSVSLMDAQSNSMYAYVHRDSQIGSKLKEALNYETDTEITVLARFNRASESGQFLIIDKFIAPNWLPETSGEKSSLEKLRSTRRQFESYAAKCNTIDDVIKADSPTPQFLAIRMLYNDFTSPECVDFNGRRIEVVLPEAGPLAQRLNSFMDGVNFQDELFVYVTLDTESGLGAKLAIQSIVYEGMHIETESEAVARKEREKELQDSRYNIFGDGRDQRLKDANNDNVLNALLAAKNGGDPKYDHALDLLTAFAVAIPERGYPRTVNGQKEYIKSVLGTPDSSGTKSFNKGNFTKWTYWNVLKNQDTEKITEDVELALTGTDILIFMSGPNNMGLGSVGGGIRNPSGLDTQTYVSLEDAIKRNWATMGFGK